MGELILCNHALASLPYHLEAVSLNLYSLEELSYYIEHNLYLLDTDFMCDELCGWVERELGLEKTGGRLREILRTGGGLADFVSCILEESCYHPPKVRAQIVGMLREMEHKSPYECAKLRADRYMENQKYNRAIREYRRLLHMPEDRNPLVVGAVWHNLGCAYARLFQFSDAIDCFEAAYEKNQNPESLRECLYACRCLWDEGRFEEIARKYGLSDAEVSDIGRSFSEAVQQDAVKASEEEIEALFREKGEQQIAGLLDEWKNTYRKNCRI